MPQDYDLAIACWCIWNRVTVQAALQHHQVHTWCRAKFGCAQRAFPVGQSLEVLKWRFVGTRMCHCRVSFILFLSTFLIIHSVNCWPPPSNDGACKVGIGYELENEHVTLYNVVISIPLPYVLSSLPFSTPPSNLSSLKSWLLPNCLLQKHRLMVPRTHLPGPSPSSRLLRKLQNQAH